MSNKYKQYGDKSIWTVIISRTGKATGTSTSVLFYDSKEKANDYIKSLNEESALFFSLDTTCTIIECKVTGYEVESIYVLPAEFAVKTQTKIKGKATQASN
jgi:hypothetical protein